jgi:hypothetical protein
MTSNTSRPVSVIVMRTRIAKATPSQVDYPVIYAEDSVQKCHAAGTEW